MSNLRISAPVALISAALLSAGPAIAHPGGWGMGWDGPMDGRGYPGPDRRRTAPNGPAEGRVEVNRFIAEDIDRSLLGKGPLSVTGASAGANAEGRELRVYEAAVVDSLAGAGYQTATTADAASQIAEVRITHDTVVPEEAPHKPVSGEVTMGVSNRGSMMGMAVAIDMTKPLKALISTRLEARIRDKASGKVLWEGRADIVTREGNPKWDDNAIAARLARALFTDFPGKSGETRTASR